MPDRTLTYRVGNLQAAPVWLEVSTDAKEAFMDRVFAAVTFGDLPAEDQALIRRGELEVSAGRSSHYQDPSTWGDWAAIEAALDAGDDAALDAALETVGPGEGGGMVDPDEAALTPEEEAELATYDEPADDTTGEVKALEVEEGLDPDDDGWVG